MRVWSIVASLLALCTLSGCVTPRHMCVAQADCGGAFACVAGRCQADDKSLQTAGRGIEIQRDGVRRLVLSPIDTAYVRRGDPASTPSTAITLGRAADGDALLFLRFDLPLPPGANVLEAYVLLDVSPDADTDPAPIALHAGAIVDPWSARGVSWAHQPRIDDARATSTTISGTRRLVRIDVRDVVRHWRLHAKTDQGIAIVAGSTSPSGLTFALVPSIDSKPAELTATPVAVPTMRTPPPSFIFASPDESSAAGATGPRGPRLEVYVR